MQVPSVSIALPAPSDYHVHLRQGAMLNLVAPYTRTFGRALVMPNTTPCEHWDNGICTVKELEAYRKIVEKAIAPCEALMTMKLTEKTTPELVRKAKKANVIAFKLYPQGVTSNSDNGIPRAFFEKAPTQFIETLSAMQEENLVLCMHGEMPGKDLRTFDSPYDSLCKINGIIHLGIKSRTGKFCEWVLDFLFKEFPQLRKVIEHITTRYEVETIRRAWKEGHKVAGTITPHHLSITIEDLIVDKLQPHLFCKPIAKHSEDRDALIDAATSGDACFFLGTDSAPHTVNKKECSDCCAGIFNAPVAIPFLIDLFLKHTPRSGHICHFTSTNGDAFYEMPKQTRMVTYTQSYWDVPQSINNVVRPFLAGQQLHWKLKMEE